MSTAKSRLFWKIKRSLPRGRNKRLLVLLVALVVLPITVVLGQRVIKLFSGAASATLSFTTSGSNLPPNQTVRLNINSGTTQVGFASFEIKFDPAKIRLIAEVVPSTALNMNNADVPVGTVLPPDACTGTTKCIIRTPVATANSTGIVTMVIAKDPRTITANPSGTFELANMNFTAVTAAATTTQVLVQNYQIVDASSNVFTVSTTPLTLTLNPGGPTVTVAPTQPSGGNITNLVVNDSTNAANWSERTNIQQGDTQYGDRTYTFSAIPTEYRGLDWIRTANASRSYTGNVATFKVNLDSVIYVAYDDRYGSLPSWLSGWSDTGANLSNTDSANPPPVFSLYSKSFTGGSTVTLGPGGGSGFSFYTVLVKRNVPPPTTVVNTPIPTIQPTSTPGPTTVVNTPIPTIQPTSTPVPTPTIPACNIQGDANGDCCVNGIDYAIWYINFGRTTSNGPRDGDFNNSGRVDGLDYAIWQINFGRCG